MGMSPEQLSALPEFREVFNETLPNGVTVQRRIAPKFVPYSPRPDDVALFHDAEGSWFVDYHLEGGPYKRRAM